MLGLAFVELTHIFQIFFMDSEVSCKVWNTPTDYQLVYSVRAK